MALTIGTQLGSHEITALLGKGGMGEVYRARDTKLKREVAIKILPDEFSRDPERVSRFQREAEVLASLNHPGIAAIYDLQEANDTRFLVLELVEGETLAERIQRGPIPVDEALDIARRICEALEAAHEKGVVHRDLKPANVKVMADGRVKVLDFGLAKAMDPSPVDGTLSNSPTLTIGATEAGVILGTAAYMSPEQAKGFQVDTRSDIFSFGALLYEMISGRPAFQGDTVQEILASVLIRDADFALLPPNLNPRIQELLQRCLQKNPKKRWQAVGDLRAELEIVAHAPRAVRAEGESIPLRPRWRRAIPVVVSTIIFSILAAVAAWWLKPTPPVTVARFVISFPADEVLDSASQEIAISPDGTKVVFAGNRQLFLRHIGDMEARPIPGTGPGTTVNRPFFSPDGEWVGFYSTADSSLKKIALTGGPAIPICKCSPLGVSWNETGIVFAEDGKGILRVSPDGGEPETLVSIKSEEGTAYGPQIIDSGRAVLFTLAATGPRNNGDRWDQAQIVVQLLASGERRIIWRGGSDARYVPSGHIVYAVGRTLMALPFDLRKLQSAGSSIRLIEGVQRSSNGIIRTGVAQFSFSNNGTLVYIPAQPDSQLSRTVLGLVDPMTGKTQVLPVPEGTYSFPQISPDGKSLAVTTLDGKDSIIYIYDLSDSRSTLRRLTFAGNNTNPVFSRPDGKYVYFTSDRDGKNRLFRKLVDGSAPEEPLMAGETDTIPLPESSDPLGRTLAFTIRRGAGGNGSIWLLPLSGDRTPQPFVGGSTGSHTHAAFSPDGRWLAYSSNEGRGNGPQVFVQPYPATKSLYEITKDGGIYPLWSPDGKQLFYVWDRVFVVDIRTEPSFSPGKPSPLPISIIQPGRSQRNFDITRDGKLLAVLDASSQDQVNPHRNQIDVVLNWFRELEERVPMK
jgi:serine/threonine-protein kinase